MSDEPTSMRIKVTGDGTRHGTRVWLVDGDTQKDISACVKFVYWAHDANGTPTLELTVLAPVVELGADARPGNIVVIDAMFGEQRTPIGCGLTPLPEAAGDA